MQRPSREQKVCFFVASGVPSSTIERGSGRNSPVVAARPSATNPPVDSTRALARLRTRARSRYRKSSSSAPNGAGSAISYSTGAGASPDSGIAESWNLAGSGAPAAAGSGTLVWIFEITPRYLLVHRPAS